MVILAGSSPANRENPPLPPFIKGGLGGFGQLPKQFFSVIWDLII
jgi:hypothetical protein